MANVCRVLVADDEVINQMILKQLLESLGCQVTLARNGVEAVKYLKSESFSLLFVDFNMPHMNGIELANAIRHLEEPANKTYIIGITACNDSNYLQEGLKAGMNVAYSKPITEKVMASILQQAHCT